MKKENDLNHIPTLQELREKAQLTQEELSRRMNVGVRIVTDWERGLKKPSLTNFFALAKTLGVSPKSLARSLGIDVSHVPSDD